MAFALIGTMEEQFMKANILVIFLAMVGTILIGCSGTNDTAIGGESFNLGNQQVERTTFNIDPDTDIASHWYSCPNVAALGSDNTDQAVNCDPPLATDIEFRNDAVQTVVVTFDNDEIKMGLWLSVDDTVLTMIGSTSVYWEIEIDGDVIAMNYTGSSAPQEPNTSDP